jgi:hypothetical protein
MRPPETVESGTRRRNLYQLTLPQLLFVGCLPILSATLIGRLLYAVLHPAHIPARAGLFGLAGFIGAAVLGFGVWPIMRRFGSYPIFVTCPICGRYPPATRQAPVVNGLWLECGRCHGRFVMRGDWVLQDDERVFRIAVPVTADLLNGTENPTETRQSRWPNFIVLWGLSTR